MYPSQYIKKLIARQPSSDIQKCQNTSWLFRVYVDVFIRGYMVVASVTKCNMK